MNRRFIQDYQEQEEVPSSEEYLDLDLIDETIDSLNLMNIRDDEDYEEESNYSSSTSSSLVEYGSSSSDDVEADTSSEGNYDDEERPRQNRERRTGELDYYDISEDQYYYSLRVSQRYQRECRESYNVLMASADMSFISDVFRQFVECASEKMQDCEVSEMADLLSLIGCGQKLLCHRLRCSAYERYYM
jgi:hypothetical protein